VVVHRINAERLVLLGWSRAILLQMAHPLVAAGVADHSHFRAGPITAARRLRDTIKAMLALSFGDAFEAGHAIAAIRAIPHARARPAARDHRRVSGRHEVFGRGSGTAALGACHAD
jgi:uncharacterized protein (DUF2236 family)